MDTIDCKLLEFTEYDGLFQVADAKTKCGAYLRSWLSNIEGIGRKKWPVAVRIEVTGLDKLLHNGSTEEEVLVQCVEHLNVIKQPKRGRRRKNPTYGNLEVYYKRIPSWLRNSAKGGRKEEARVRLVEDDDGEKYLAAVLVTDQIKNKLFWGSGLKR